MENAFEVEITELSPVERRLSVRVSPERVAATRELVIREFVKQAQLPGFRPGKAPRELVESRFREEITQKIEHQIIQETFEEILTLHKLPVVAVGRVETSGNESPEEFRYSLNLEVLPEIPLTEIPRLRLKKPVRVVREEDIDQVLSNLRDEFTRFLPAEEGAESRVGDRVKLEYRTWKEGELPPEQGEIYEGILSPQHLLPQVVERLEGLKVGEEREFTLTFPDTPEVAEPLRGNTLHYRFRLHELKRALPPRFDEAEIQEYFGEKDMGALRQRIKRNLEQANEERSQKVLQQEIREAVGKSFQFPVPSSLTQEELKALLTAVMRDERFQHLQAESRESLIQQLIGNLTPVAENNVRVSLVLERIARLAGLSPTPTEVDLELSRIAQYYKMDPQQFFRTARESGIRDRVYARLLEQKALELLRDQAEIEEIPWEEWEKQANERRDE